MVKKIVSTVILFGLVAGFPGAHAFSQELGLGNVPQDNRRTRHFVKKVRKVHERSVKRYCQASNDVTVCAQALNDEDCGLLLSKTISQAGMQAILLTIQNNSQDVVMLNGNSISLPILDERIVMALMKDAPLTLSSFLWNGYGLHFMPTLLLLPLLLPIMIFAPFLAILYLSIPVWINVIVSLFVVPLFPFITLLSYNYFKYYYFSQDLHDRILNPRDQWALYPGQRLDRIIFVYEDANMDSFTLKLHAKSTEIPPFFVTV